MVGTSPDTSSVGYSPDQKRLKDFVWHDSRFNSVRSMPQIMLLAGLGDALLAELEIFTAQRVARALGFKLELRKNLPDYSYRKLPKIKIKGFSYAFVKLPPSSSLLEEIVSGSPVVD